MDQTNAFRCDICASLDRAWYLPGDQVSGQCYLHCYSEVAASKQGSLKPFVMRDEDNFFCADAGGFLDEDGEKAILVHSVIATVESRCDISRGLVQVRWNESVCDGDLQLTEQNKSVGGFFSSLLPGRRGASRILFRTPKLTIASGMPLSNGECCGVGFSFRLPECASPSFAGEGCQIATVVQMSVSWRVRRGKASSTVQTETLKLPIRIVIPPSSTPYLIASLAPVVTADSPLVLRNYELSKWLLSPVPSTQLTAAPWDAARERFVFERDEGWLCMKAAQRERHDALCAPNGPEQFRVAVPGSTCEICVHLSSTHVYVGQELTGFVTVSAPAGGSDDPASAARQMLPADSRGVVLKACASLEQLECYGADETKVDVPFLSSDTHLKCVRTNVADRQEWAVSTGSQSAFKFFLRPQFPTSMTTDIFTSVWRLQLSFLCTSETYAEREPARGYPTLTASPALVIPLTLSPPPLSLRVPVGQLHS